MIDLLGSELDNAPVKTQAVDQYLWKLSAKYGDVQMEAIFSRFSAGGLPSLVEALTLSVEGCGPLWSWINGYFIILARVDQHAPRYLCHLLQSGRRGLALFPTMVADIMGTAVQMHGTYIGPLSGAMRSVALEALAGVGLLLLNVLAMSTPKVRRAGLFPELRKALLPIYLKYEHKHNDDPYLKDVFHEVIRLLEGQTSSPSVDHDIANRIGKNRCKRPNCHKTCSNAQLFQCSRCMVVLYCSKKHQIEDWEDLEAPHGPVCYRTRW